MFDIISADWPKNAKFSTRRYLLYVLPNIRICAPIQHLLTSRKC